MNFGPDRRKHPRADADFTLTLEGQPDRDDAILVKDVSKAGVCCLLEEPIPVMTEVSMRLQIPSGYGAVSEVNCHGAVVRCAPLSASSRQKARGEQCSPAYEVAIFFLHMDSTDRETIDRYVHTLLSSKATSATASNRSEN